MTQKNQPLNENVPDKTGSRKAKRMFITTSDEHTKFELIRQGFEFLTKSGDRYVFANDEARAMHLKNFSQLKDIEFTDMLTF